MNEGKYNFMENKGLEKEISKFYESTRNIKYQISSINKDIEKAKKPSYIEKRKTRLIGNFKVLCEKYKSITNLDNQEKQKMKKELLEIGNNIKIVCGEKHTSVKRENVKVINNSVEDKQEVNRNVSLEEETYIASKNQKIRRVYGTDGNLDFVYAVQADERYKANRRKEQEKKERREKRAERKKEKDKKENIREKIINSGKKFWESFKQVRLGKRIAAIGMGALMLLPGAINASQTENNMKTEKTTNSYTNQLENIPINNNQLVKQTQRYEQIQDTQSTCEMQTTQSKQDTGTTVTEKERQETQKTEEAQKNNIEKKENGLEKESNEEEIHIIAPAQSKYTEVSDGSGNYGIFNKDTEVAIYNRALIRTNSDGTKSILKATKIGQSWKEYAEEKGIDYNELKEYIENNENIQEVISTMSVDGESIYGWMPASNLEYRSADKELKVDRSYIAEVEER